MADGAEAELVAGGGGGFASWLCLPSGLLDAPTDTELWLADEEPVGLVDANVS